MINKCVSNEPVVSVITTVYNTEEYVERCFDSIVNQSYKNIEFIIVNNASNGNIIEIYQRYCQLYPARTIKLVTLKENKGLFNGRLAGAEIATGDYIAFVDSDDRVSLDFYRCLVEKSIETGADMVAADFVYEDENGALSRDVLNPIPTYNFEYEGKDILKLFIDEAATAFYWNLIWNKLYTRELWDKCVPHYKMNKNSIVMCDDIAFTTVLYSFSRKYVNTHLTKYYYLRRSSACSVANNSYKKYKSILTDIISVFDFISNFLLNNNFISDISELNEWKNRYFRMWSSGISNSTLSGVEKKALIDFYKNGLDIKDCPKNDNSDTLCINRTIPVDDAIEVIKNQILSDDIDVVSFDIFDTLVLRNLWEPFDLFIFLEKKFNELNGSTVYIAFSKIRSYAESITRTRICQPHSSCQEITLDQIYDTIEDLYHFDKNLLAQIKEEELKLEKHFICRRETAYDIYKLAVYCGKKVICISDMYLPIDFLTEILNSLGYTHISKIYLSSSCGTTKANGKLYDIAVNDMKTSAKRIFHIGDNMDTDVYMAKNKGLNSANLCKAMTAYAQKSMGFYRMFFEKKEAMYQCTIFENIDTRCLMALVVNKIFDNPAINFLYDSEFNSDPYFIGYFCVGFYVLCALKWIQANVKQYNYSTINFISRDGYLLKEAYDLFFPKETMPKSNYFYASRNAMLPCAISNINDFWGISNMVYYGNYSPKSVIETFSVLSANSVEVMLTKAKADNFATDVKFDTKEAFDTFLYYFATNFFDKATADKYKCEIKEYIKSSFPEKSCSVDVGYSGRTEGILSKLLGYPIDALYLYRNGDKCENNRITYHNDIHTMCDYFPKITEEILIELLMSSSAPSCKGYKKANGTFEPYFAKDQSQNYITRFFIEVMHRGAIDFVCDFKKNLGEFWDIFLLRKMDMTYPLNYLLHYSSQNDFYFLSSALFDDNMSLSNQQTLDVLRENDLHIINNTFILQSELRSFKDKVKDKLKNHPRLFSIAKKVYHVFKRR